MGEGTGIAGEAPLHQFGMGDGAEPFIFHMLTHALVFSAYALIALGLTLIFGTLGVVNFAHGALFMIGASAPLRSAA